MEETDRIDRAETAGTVAEPLTGSDTTAVETGRPSSTDGERLPMPEGRALRSTPWDMPAAAENPAAWRDTTANAVFGTQSVLETAPDPYRNTRAKHIENPPFQGFVLLLAAVYALLLYRNFRDIKALFEHISHERAGKVRPSEDPGGSGFLHFLNLTTVIGMLFVGVIAARYGYELIPHILPERLAYIEVVIMCCATALACMAVAAIQRTILRIVGAITVARPFVDQLILLRQTYFALAVVIAAPAIILLALIPRGNGFVWLAVIATELAVTAILYLKKSANLFLAKKISILHWILYLCGVEIFPISLLWMLVAR